MYNKNDILLKLNSENYYIDRRTLSAFISSWNIEAVYENEQKEEYLDRLTIGSQVSVIKSFTNKELIKKYAEKEEYSQYRSDLIISTEEENYIIEKFIKTTSLKLKLNIINKVEDQNLKTFLTCFLDDKNMMEFLISNSYEPNISENVTSLINRTKI